MLNLILDLGVNDGSDLEYYLSRANKVVAVEANPGLTHQIEAKYSAHIKAGKLVVIQGVVTVDPSQQGDILFNIAPNDPAKSKIAKQGEVGKSNSVVPIRSVFLNDIFVRYGVPDYLKIDLEGYDKEILRFLHENPSSWPNYLSFERQYPPLIQEFFINSPYEHYNIVSFYNYKKIYGNRRDGKWGGDIGTIRRRRRKPLVHARRFIGNRQ